MGNVQSGPSQTNRPPREALTAPAPQLDFKNMPFLKPPDGYSIESARPASGAALSGAAPSGAAPGAAPLSAVGTAGALPVGHASSSALGSTGSASIDPRTPDISCTSPTTASPEWFQGHARRADVQHALDASPGASMRAEIGVASTTSLHAHSAASEPASPVPESLSSSSISSQLSVLSRMSSPGSSPRSHRHNFPAHHATRSSVNVFHVDASMPPEVPPHRVFPSKPANAETETVLAAIEALELEIEQETPNRHAEPPGSPVMRSRSRSISLSRQRSRSISLSRRRSVAPADAAGPEVMRTDVYTRKCSSPDTPPGLQYASSTDTPSDTEADPPSPFSDSSFSLTGYNDGTTRLRVVNLDSPPQPATMLLPSAVSRETVRPESFRVKSKAQLAEEEEDMLRKRYARYGHTFRGSRRA